MTFNGNFVEPLSMVGRSGWPHRHVTMDIVKEKSRYLDKEKYHQEILRVFKKNERIRGGRSYEDWRDVINKNSSLSQDDLYSQIAKLYQSELLGFRWNQCLFYAPSWLSRSNSHYWVMVVRSPLDRSVSAMKTHDWSFNACMEAAKSYADKYKIINEMFPDRFLKIHYEDIIESPESEMKHFFEKIKMDVSSIELSDLIGADMERYKNEGWRAKGNTGTHKGGEEFEKLHSKSIDQYKKLLSKDQINSLRQIMNNDLYGRYL
tara:strand:+ start:25922 stop:26707 length:786 start_codon:yes stop_codon:yes gene_type:complete